MKKYAQNVQIELWAQSYSKVFIDRTLSMELSGIDLFVGRFILFRAYAT